LKDVSANLIVEISVTVEWFHPLLPILEVCGSNIGTETDYPD